MLPDAVIQPVTLLSFASPVKPLGGGVKGQAVRCEAVGCQGKPVVLPLIMTANSLALVACERRVLAPRNESRM
jgi:hypothetical protein